MGNNHKANILLKKRMYNFKGYKQRIINNQKNLRIPLKPKIILNLILFFIINPTKNYHAQTKKLKIYFNTLDKNPNFSMKTWYKNIE